MRTEIADRIATYINFLRTQIEDVEFDLSVTLGYQKQLIKKETVLWAEDFKKLWDDLNNYTEFACADFGGWLAVAFPEFFSMCQCHGVVYPNSYAKNIDKINGCFYRPHKYRHQSIIDFFGLQEYSDQVVRMETGKRPIGFCSRKKFTSDRKAVIGFLETVLLDHDYVFNSKDGTA